MVRATILDERRSPERAIETHHGYGSAIYQLGWYCGVVRVVTGAGEVWCLGLNPCLVVPSPLGVTPSSEGLVWER